MTISEKNALQERRKSASDASLGLSSDEILAALLDLAQARGVAGGAALDFGAGQGRFAQMLAATGTFSSVTGSDIMPRPNGLPREIAWHSTDLNGPLPPDLHSRFDVVFSPEVIEHLENPRETARSWFSALRPGGSLIASTPNCESLRSLLSLWARGQHVAFTDRSYPAHITALLASDLRRALSETGFDQIETCYIGRGALPGLTRLSWQDLSLGLLRGRRFSDTLAIIARRPLTRRPLK